MLTGHQAASVTGACRSLEVTIKHAITECDTGSPQNAKAMLLGAIGRIHELRALLGTTY